MLKLPTLSGFHDLFLKYKIHLHMLRNREEKIAKGSLFLPVAKACTNNFYIFRQCPYIVYIYKWYLTVTCLMGKLVQKLMSIPFIDDLFYFFLFLVFYRHFQQYFSYIMVTSFSGGRSRNTRREPPTTGKQLVNFVTCSCESSSPFFVI
jgi:hypothetical protein